MSGLSLPGLETISGSGNAGPSTATGGNASTGAKNTNVGGVNFGNQGAGLNSPVVILAIVAAAFFLLKKSKKG